MNRNKLIKLLLCISLFASVTNFIPLSVSYCLLILLIPIICSKIPVKSVFWSLLCLYIVFFVSTLIYYPKSFIDFSFYRRDGNFFITYLPMLMLVQQKRWFNTELVVKKFIYFGTIINLACMVLPRMGVNPFEIICIETFTVNHFLFEAHNAAGGFISILLAFNIGFFLSGKSEQTRKKMLLCSFVNLIALIDSGSRGTLIAFVVAILLFALMQKSLKERKYIRSIDKFLFLIAITINIVIVMAVSDERIFKFILNTLQISNRIFAIGDRLTNLWPKAIKLFSSSPIVGTGYGSFNDEPINLRIIIRGILAFNNPNDYIFSSAHAHNSFLHVMAETGIVGLVFLLYFLDCLRHRIVRIHNNAIKYGLYIGLCINIFSSFTEHRIFTPSQMIPYVLVFGMIVSEERSKKFREKTF